MGGACTAESPIQYSGKACTVGVGGAHTVGGARRIGEACAFAVGDIQ